MEEIYLDNSATTRMRREALEKFTEVATRCFGNASSLHACGQAAAKELNVARRAVCASRGTREGELIFTSGGSEANDLALFGRAYAKARFRCGSRIITTAGEHASVSMPLARLREEGYDIVEIGTRGGELAMDELRAALNEKTILVSIMMVNNETGAIYDTKTAAALTHALAPDAVFHTDATQSYLKIPFSVRDGYDMVTVSSHKVEGPKGCGALWVAPAVIKNKGLAPRLLGGGQEDGFRSGTENVPALAAFGVAAALGQAEWESRTAALQRLRQLLSARLAEDAGMREVRLNLPKNPAPHILSLTMPSIKSETMLHYLSSCGIYVSSGSACSSHGRHTAPPLAAFGLSEREADCTIRVSLSPRNTEEELSRFADALARGVATLVRIR